MGPLKETVQSYEFNPRIIGEQIVQTLLADLTDDPLTDLQILRDKRLNNVSFSDIFYDDFQIWRMGALGWKIQLSEEEKKKYDLTLDSISTFGPDDYDGQNGYFSDFFIGANLMRAYIASAFVEQARIEKLPTPEINNNIIDAMPVKREEFDNVYASREGMFVFEADELLSRWQEENPELYETTSSLISDLSGKFTERTQKMYEGHLPTVFLQELAAEIRKQWEKTLREYALRTYAILTPHPPELIEVKVRTET